MTATPCDVIERARNYVGVPYRHQGRNNQGLDCIGLVWRVCADIGSEVSDVGGYGPEPFNGQLQREVGRRGLLATGPHPGTLVLMRWFDEPQHCAIVTDIGTIIHAHSKVGKVVEHRLDDKWAKRIIISFGFPGVSYEPSVLEPEIAQATSAVILPAKRPVLMWPAGECLPCRKQREVSAHG